MARVYAGNGSTAAVPPAAPPDPVDGVIAALRGRGRTAERRANWILAALIGLVAIGTGYYIGRPLLRTYYDGIRASWENQVRIWQESSDDLDAERTQIRDRLVGVLTPAGTPVVSGVESRLATLVTLADGKTLVAAGEGGAITRSTDAGATWTPAVSGGEAHLFSLVPLADGRTLVAAGAGGAITRSTDAGATWTPAVSGVGAWHTSLIPLADGRTLVAAGEGGAITRSTDTGATWTPAVSGVGAWLTSLIPLADGRTLVAAGEGGAITRSTDAGVTWTPAVSGVGARLASLIPLADGRTLVAAGEGGAITRSTDAGATWTPAVSGVGAWLTSLIPLADGRTLVAAGEGGAITRSTDAGATWTPAVSGVEAPLYSLVPLPDGRTLVASAWDGTITRSTDAGANWTRAVSGIPVSLRTAGLRSVVVLLADGRTLVAAGKGGAITRSTDAGATWTPIVSGGEAPFDTLVPLADGRAIVAAGWGGAIVRIDDALAQSLSTLDLPRGIAGDGALANWIAALPAPSQAFPAVDAAAESLAGLRERRKPVVEALTTAQQALADRRNGTASLREQQVAFETFMRACRADATEQAEIGQDCVKAWQLAQADDTRNWWTVLAEQVPPGILLLFLLATLSALYRYNVRLAGFHFSRADALVLLREGLSVKDLTQIADAMAADKVEFGPGKTPTDHAAEMATALINRSKP